MMTLFFKPSMILQSNNTVEMLLDAATNNKIPKSKLAPIAAAATLGVMAVANLDMEHTKLVGQSLDRLHNARMGQNCAEGLDELSQGISKLTDLENRRAHSNPVGRLANDIFSGDNSIVTAKNIETACLKAVSAANIKNNHGL